MPEAIISAKGTEAPTVRSGRFTQEFPGIRRKLWKEYFWSRSFCLLTTGGAPVEVIRKYIEDQGEKSRTQA